MYARQRYWYASALAFLLVSLVVGGWAWSRFLAARNAHGPALHIAQATPTVAGRTRATSFLDFSAGAHLLIPKIGINAPVESLGVTAQGALDTPKQNPWTGVGWYKDGPVPGQRGSAVIDGHLDRPGGSPAVFWNLRNLHPGDIVMVADAHNHMLHFRVTKLAYYPPQNAPTNQIFGNTSGTFLNLVTCAGTWIPAQHQTTQRLVVYTTLDTTQN